MRTSALARRCPPLRRAKALAGLERFGGLARAPRRALAATSLAGAGKDGEGEGERGVLPFSRISAVVGHLADILSALRGRGYIHSRHKARGGLRRNAGAARPSPRLRVHRR
jgi:hypothetical protein